jgi:hypothetical protein
MAKHGKLIVKDEVWQKLQKEFKKMESQPHVDVGVRGSSALEGKKDAFGKVTEAVRLVDIATFHEFGTSHGVPERSFIRSTLFENNLYREMRKKLSISILSLKMDVSKALGLLGLKYQSDIQAKIRAGIDPPLTFETEQRKGSTTPLIDTGQLIQGITYEVKDK